MKKKKIAKSLKRLQREVQKLEAREDSVWSAAFATIAGAVASALSEAKLRDVLAELVAEAKAAAPPFVARPPEEPPSEALGELQNGMVMDENPGPV